MQPEKIKSEGLNIMVSTATLKKHTTTTNTPSPTTHTKRKLHELGDISNTPTHKQQKQQHNSHRHHDTNNSSWQRRQRQQQLTNDMKYMNDDDISTPKSKRSMTSSTNSTPDKPVTRLNLKHQMLVQQQRQKQGAKDEEGAQTQPPLKCKIKRQLHSSGDQENYTHQVEQHRQTSPSPTDISSPPAMNQDEEYMLQEITKKSQYFNQPMSNHVDNDSADQNHQHRRCKSVTFKLPHDEEKGFESSPLLTPKNDDSDLEEEILARHKQQLQIQKEQELVSVYPSTPPESFQHDEEDEDVMNVDEVETSPMEQVFSPQSQSQSMALEAKSEIQQQLLSDILSKNTDYISLSSTLTLIQNQREQIEQDIVQLSQLKSQINTSSKEDTIKFVTKLLQGGNQLDLPEPTPIVTCPYIQWEKYHPTLANISLDLQAESNKSNKNDLPFKFVI